MNPQVRVIALIAFPSCGDGYIDGGGSKGRVRSLLKPPLMITSLITGIDGKFRDSVRSV